MKPLTVAIDGPAGAGKSTVARQLAKQLKYIYIDTGAMYRAVALAVLRSGIATDDIQRIVEFTSKLDIKLKYEGGANRVWLDGEDVTNEIRTPEVSKLVSIIAQIPAVRQIMLERQRELAKGGGVVMDGRDIGTKVLPHADVKIFLTASIAERARRRWLELVEKGYDIDLADLEQEIARRDQMDRERAVSPLVQAADAILIDTTNLSIEQAVDRIMAICKERG